MVFIPFRCIFFNETIIREKKKKSFQFLAKANWDLSQFCCLDKTITMKVDLVGQWQRFFLSVL